MLLDTFYCNSCVNWFKKRSFLEETYAIKTKCEYLSPNNSPIKINDDEDLVFIKKEKSSNEKRALKNEYDEVITENYDNNVENKNHEFSLNIDKLLDKLPTIKSRLPVTDFIQMMYFFEVLTENINQQCTSFDKKQYIVLLRLFASLPFNNHKILKKFTLKIFNESFLEKEILEKFVPKLVSLYDINNSFIRFVNLISVAQ